jgi:hypothetical protein
VKSKTVITWLIWNVLRYSIQKDQFLENSALKFVTVCWYSYLLLL